jgi:hypothetical protein
LIFIGGAKAYAPRVNSNMAKRKQPKDSEVLPDAPSSHINAESDDIGSDDVGTTLVLRFYQCSLTAMTGQRYGQCGFRVVRPATGT